MELLTRDALTEAARWALLAALLAYASTRLAFAPPSLSAERAQKLRDEIDQDLADGHLAEGLYTVRRLLRSFPEDSSNVRREAEIYGRLGDHKSEAAAYEIAMRLSPTPTENCPALGRAYLKQGFLDKALDADRRCLEFSPNNVDMRLYYALALERSKRAAEARRAFEAVLELAPAYSDASTGLARLDLEAGRPADAARRMRAVNLKDPSADSLAAEARAEIALGRRDHAKQLLREALKLSPDYAGLREQLNALESK